MIYVPTKLALASSWKLSADLWAHVSNGAVGTTQYLVAPVEHPVTGAVYFGMEADQAAALGLDTSDALHDWPAPRPDDGEWQWDEVAGEWVPVPDDEGLI